MFFIRRIRPSAAWFPWGEAGSRSATFLLLLALGFSLSVWVAWHRPAEGASRLVAVALAAVALTLCSTRLARTRNRNRTALESELTGRKAIEENLQRSEAALRASQNELDRVSGDLRRLSGELMRSQDEERRRLARELHDGVGQNLVALQLMLSGSSGAAAPPAAIELVEQVQREIRTLSYLLHPPLLDQLGLASALRAYVDGFSSRTGIPVECRIPGDFGRLGRDTETALFRIVQEALGNIRKHSGSASAHLALARTEGAVVLTVTDRGRGIPAEVLRPGGGGVGLAGMRQRAAQLGGRTEIETGPDGTTVTVRIPVAGHPSRLADARPA